jgi:multidrug efflux pump subunit AcrA (membrane-fusion protein)
MPGFATLSCVRFTTACLFLCLLLTACAGPPPANPTPVPDLPTPAAPVFTVQRGLVARGVEFTARVQPASSETLAFRVDGRIFKLNVKEGDQVKQGDVLAELDLSDLKKELEQQLIRLRTAQTVLSNTLLTFSDTLRLAQLDVEQARLRVEIAQARTGAGNTGLNIDLRELDKRIADFRTAINAARNRFDQAAADEGQRQLDDLLVQREKLLASLDDAGRDGRVRELEVSLLQADVVRAELNLRKLRGELDPGLIEQVETARVAVEATQDRIGNGSLIAPFDGEVGLITVKVGDSVRALAPLMVVARPGELELVGQPTEQQLSEISLGQPVSVSFLIAGAAPVAGVVARVPILGNDATSSTRQRVVRIRILEDGVQLANGQLARIRTVLSQRENVLWIPPSVLRTFRAREFVVIREPDGSERRADIKTGLRSGDRIEVQDGLKEGEIIVAP